MKHLSEDIVSIEAFNVIKKDVAKFFANGVQHGKTEIAQAFGMGESLESVFDSNRKYREILSQVPMLTKKTQLVTFLLEKCETFHEFTFFMTIAMDIHTTHRITGLFPRPFDKYFE